MLALYILKENVNPNKVYILGYSAGGDGVYQLAPRMADRWAAASMMAGHPNEASPLGLRNTPFAIHVGALDNSYNRNGKAEEWGIELATLQANDGQGYIHDVQLHPGLRHWMNLQDAEALPWMKNYERDPVPQKVVWKQDNVHHSNFYWIETPENEIITGGEILAEYNSSLNEINIIENYSDKIKLLINDNMLDLDNSITIKYQNTIIYNGLFHRTILNIYESLSVKGDSNLAFPCAALVRDNQTVFEEDVTLSISSPNDLDKISIYPNPFNNYINIVLPLQSGKESTISIIDIQGKIIKKLKTEYRNSKIDFSKLSNQIYVVKVENGEQVFISKLVKY